jgi:hypothetical protein
LAAVVNGKIVMIYPKSALCDDDIYRETRYFVAWKLKQTIVNFKLDPEFGFEQVGFQHYAYINTMFRKQFPSEMPLLKARTVFALDSNYVKSYGLPRQRQLITLSKQLISHVMQVEVTTFSANHINVLINSFWAKHKNWVAFICIQIIVDATEIVSTMTECLQLQ